MRVYTEVGVRVEGNLDLGRSYISHARTLLGIMKGFNNKLAIQNWQRELPDGTMIYLSSIHNTDYIRILAPTIEVDDYIPLTSYVDARIYYGNNPFEPESIFFHVEDDNFTASQFPVPPYDETVFTHTNPSFDKGTVSNRNRYLSSVPEEDKIEPICVSRTISDTEDLVSFTGRNHPYLWTNDSDYPSVSPYMVTYKGTNVYTGDFIHDARVVNETLYILTGSTGQNGNMSIYSVPVETEDPTFTYLGGLNFSNQYLYDADYDPLPAGTHPSGARWKLYTAKLNLSCTEVSVFAKADYTDSLPYFNPALNSNLSFRNHTGLSVTIDISAATYNVVQHPDNYSQILITERNNISSSTPSTLEQCPIWWGTSDTFLGIEGTPSVASIPTDLTSAAEIYSGMDDEQVLIDNGAIAHGPTFTNYGQTFPYTTGLPGIGATDGGKYVSTASAEPTFPTPIASDSSTVSTRVFGLFNQVYQVSSSSWVTVGTGWDAVQVNKPHVYVSTAVGNYTMQMDVIGSGMKVGIFYDEDSTSPTYKEAVYLTYRPTKEVIAEVEQPLLPIIWQEDFDLKDVNDYGSAPPSGHDARANGFDTWVAPYETLRTRNGYTVQGDDIVFGIYFGDRLIAHEGGSQIAPRHTYTHEEQYQFVGSNMNPVSRKRYRESPTRTDDLSDLYSGPIVIAENHSNFIQPAGWFPSIEFSAFQSNQSDRRRYSKEMAGGDPLYVGEAYERRYTNLNKVVIDGEVYIHSEGLDSTDFTTATYSTSAGRSYGGAGGNPTFRGAQTPSAAHIHASATVHYSISAFDVIDYECMSALYHKLVEDNTDSTNDRWILAGSTYIIDDHDPKIPNNYLYIIGEQSTDIDNTLAIDTDILQVQVAGGYTSLSNGNPNQDRKDWVLVAGTNT